MKKLAEGLSLLTKAKLNQGRKFMRINPMAIGGISLGVGLAAGAIFGVATGGAVLLSALVAGVTLAVQSAFLAHKTNNEPRPVTKCYIFTTLLGATLIPGAGIVAGVALGVFGAMSASILGIALVAFPLVVTPIALFVVGIN